MAQKRTISTTVTSSWKTQSIIKLAGKEETRKKERTKQRKVEVKRKEGTSYYQ